MSGKILMLICFDENVIVAGLLGGICSVTSAIFLSFQKHEFFVDMTCEGCSNAVTRVLNKLGGE